MKNLNKKITFLPLTFLPLTFLLLIVLLFVFLPVLKNKETFVQQKAPVTVAEVLTPIDTSSPTVERPKESPVERPQPTGGSTTQDGSDDTSSSGSSSGSNSNNDDDPVDDEPVDWEERFNNCNADLEDTDEMLTRRESELEKLYLKWGIVRDAALVFDDEFLTVTATIEEQHEED